MAASTPIKLLHCCTTHTIPTSSPNSHITTFLLALNALKTNPTASFPFDQPCPPQSTSKSKSKANAKLPTLLIEYEIRGIGDYERPSKFFYFVPRGSLYVFLPFS